METANNQLLTTVSANWQALTGERLWVWTGDEMELPSGLTAAKLTSIQSPTAFQFDQQTWLAARLDTRPKARYVFSRHPGGNGERLFSSFIDLLQTLQAQKTAEQQHERALQLAARQLEMLQTMTLAALDSNDLNSIFPRLLARLRPFFNAEDICLLFQVNDQTSIYTANGPIQPGLNELAAWCIGSTPWLWLQREHNFSPALTRELPGVEQLALSVQTLGASGGVLLALLNPSLATPDDSERLLPAAVQHISLLVNAAMLCAGQQASQRLDHELAIANQFQNNLLPTTLPHLPGLEFAAALKSAFQVGGDFYDIQPVEGGLAIMIGDVAGKGIPAALLTALVHATLKSEAQHLRQPAELLRSLNHLTYAELDRSNTFITAFLAVLQFNPLQLSYASAGHTTTLLWQAAQGSLQKLSSTGLPMGIVPDLQLTQRVQPLHPGDLLVLYTDGITEAENAHGRVFGTQALIDLVLAGYPAQADQQLALILEALDQHRGDVPLRDDVALFLARAVTDDAHQEVQPFVFPAERSSLRRLAQVIRQAAGRLQFTSAEQRQCFQDEVELAVGEIAANIVQHAYEDGRLTGRLQGRICLTPSQIQVDLIDSGKPFLAPLQSDKPPFPLDNPPSSGYGLLLARRLLDVCQYKNTDDGRNHWHLEKNTT